jgi:hypothetical protein
MRPMCRKLQDFRSPTPIDTPPYTPESLMPSRRCLLWLKPQGRLIHAAYMGYPYGYIRSNRKRPAGVAR